MTTVRISAIVIGMLALAGCNNVPLPPLTNEEIIQQVKLCEDAGLKAQMLIGAWNSRVVVVQCVIEE